MKSNKKYIIISLLLMFVLVSCEDYLERYPLNNPSDATFLSNETELDMALTGCYNGLHEISYGRWVTPINLIFDAGTDITWTRTGNRFMGDVSLDSRSGDVVKMWTGLYKGIAKCNYLISNMDRAIDKVNQAKFDQIKSEARFLRSLYYHYLIELYGGVPLLTEPLSLSNSQVARNSKEEVVDFIINELDESAAHLPEQNNPLLGRATKGAAWALLSRVALYNQRWDEAIVAAQKVMDLEGTEYVIDPDYESLFGYEGQDSKEVIFSLQYLRGHLVHAVYEQHATRLGKGFANWAPTYQTADSWECIDGLPIDESPLFDPKHPFENRDPRLGYTIAVPGSVFLGFQYETHGDSLMVWDYNQDPPQRIPNLEATHAYAAFTGLNWRKYTPLDDLADKANSELNIILMRYAEVLLNYAEAKIMAGQVDQSVLDAINKIRQRPSVNMPPITTTDAEELKFAVYRERKYELTREGLRLFDIRRWGIAEEVMNMRILGRMKKSYPDKAPRIDKYATAHYDDIPIAQPGESADFKMRVVSERTFDKDKDYLWPIPYIEMDTNSKMEQNPGYGSE